MTTFLRYDWMKRSLIEYEEKGRKKTINGNINETELQKKHRFQIGDAVSCRIKLSPRGDRMAAVDIKFLFNTGLDMLLNRARTENNFTGYLKIVDGKYFVKEIGTYLFFPAPFSPWQLIPSESEWNEAVTFALENLDNKEKLTASLFNIKFIPEYYSAVKAFKTKTPVEATVDKVTPHGIYLSLFGKKIQAKISLKKELEEKSLPATAIKTGDKIKVIITYLSPTRIIVEDVQ